MQFSNIIRKAEYFIVSYRRKNNVSMVTIPTPFGELLRLFPNKKLLYDTGDFLFYDKKVLSLDYIPINAEYFDGKNCNFQYSSLRGKNRVITLPSQTLYKDYPYISYVSYYFNNSEKSLPDTIREGSIFIDNREVDFFNNSEERKIEQLIYKSPDILITCKARDLLSTIQKLFSAIDKRGEYRGGKFYKTPQDYPVFIYPTCYGSILTIKAQNISLGFNACLKSDNPKIDYIAIDPSSLAYFADKILPSFKGNILIYYHAKTNKCIIRNKNKAFVLDTCNKAKKPSADILFDKARTIEYQIKDTQSFKTAILNACKNVYGLGGKKASLNICIDFLEKEIIIHSYNQLRDETKTTVIKQEDINRGYPIAQIDNVLPLSRLYFDANTCKKMFETIGDNDQSSLVLSVDTLSKYADIKTDLFTCSIKYKTEKDIHKENNQTRQEDIKNLIEQSEILLNNRKKYRGTINFIQAKIADAEKSVETIKASVYKEGSKKQSLTKTDLKDIRALRNRIDRYKSKLYDTISGKKVKGLFTLVKETSKEVNYIFNLIVLMQHTDLSLKQAIYVVGKSKEPKNKNKNILEMAKNAITKKQEGTFDLTTLIDYEREEQEKTNVSLLLQELEQHKKLLKEEKERAKQEEKERKAREKALREKARLEKKAQEEKAKEEKRLAREKERQAREQARQEEKANKRIYRKYSPVTYIEDLDKKLDILDNYQPQEIKIETIDYSVPKVYKPYIRRQKTYNKKENNSIYALVGLSLIGSISAAIALVIYLL